MSRGHRRQWCGRTGTKAPRVEVKAVFAIARGHVCRPVKCQLLTQSRHSCETKRRLLTMIVSVIPRSADIFHLVQIIAVALGFHVVARDEPQ